MSQGFQTEGYRRYWALAALKAGCCQLHHQRMVVELHSFPSALTGLYRCWSGAWEQPAQHQQRCKYALL